MSQSGNPQTRSLVKRILTTALLGLVLPGITGTAKSDPIILTPMQMEQAGIASERVTAATDAATGGNQLRLGGTVVVPNTGLHLVSAPFPGILQRLLVNPLEEVRASQPVAVLYSTEYLSEQQRYLEARAAAEVAKARADRDAELFKEGIIAASRFEESRALQTAAQAKWQEHRHGLKVAGLSDAALDRLSDAGDLTPELTVASRIAGSVMEQLAIPGQRVEAGAPLFRVADSSRLWVELHATVAESMGIQPGSAVTVAGCQTPGRIVATGQHLTSSSQSVLLRAEFNEPGSCLRPNQYVEVLVTTAAGDARAVGVPASAVVRSLGQDYVFLRTDAGFTPTPVTTVARGTDRIWVTGNLSTDSEIAIRGIAALRGAWIGLGPESADEEAP